MCPKNLEFDNLGKKLWNLENLKKLYFFHILVVNIFVIIKNINFTFFRL